MSFLRTVVMFGAGYVLGAKAGRGRYEQIKAQSKKLWNSQAIRDGRVKVKSTASQAFQRATDAAVANAKNAVSAAATKLKDTSSSKLNHVEYPDTPAADEIIVEPLADFKDRL